MFNFSLSSKKVSAALSFCLIAGVCTGSAFAAESEASSAASSEASTQSAAASSSEAAHESSSAAASESGSEASVHPSSSAASQSGGTGLIGRPTVINRGNVGGQILQAAGQSSRSTRSSTTRSYGRGVSTGKKRTAHWKTQVWNQKSTAKTAH